MQSGQEDEVPSVWQGWLISSSFREMAAAETERTRLHLLWYS